MTAESAILEPEKVISGKRTGQGGCLQFYPDPASAIQEDSSHGDC
jgi:hypothetical protein